MDELRISPEGFQELLEKMTVAMTDAIRFMDTGPTRFIDSLEDGPEAVEAARRLASKLQEEDVPETGRDMADILDLVCNVAARSGKNDSAAGFCAYVPTGGLLQSAAAELLCSCLNRATARFLSNPGLVQLESNVIRWMGKIVGYDPGRSFGSFASGGSMANFIGVLASRRRYLSEEQILEGVVLATSQTHTCIVKGLVMAGIPQSAMRLVPCDAKLRMDATALEASIVKERKAGRKPFLVVASAGTTNTGAVDDLRAVSVVCQRHDVWLHVDAVYGAAFNLTERGRDALDGLEEADSIAIDLHKSFFLPQATGLTMVKERAHLKRAFSVETDLPFLPGMCEDEDNFLELSMQLTRPCYGLRLWFPLQLCGLSKWRQALDERLDWTAEFAHELRQMESLGVRLATEPSLSILTFCYDSPPGQAGKSASLDDSADTASSASKEHIQHMCKLNEKLLLFINQRDNIYLSGTTLPDGRFVIRVCILYIRLTKERLMRGLVDIRDGVQELTT
eukprot:scpid60691/ scgid4748/ Aromatic-L-amino-acid decarboxylase; DOPA decarboxylase